MLYWLSVITARLVSEAAGMGFYSDAMNELEHLVDLCAANHNTKELALGWLRYETLRRMNPRQFSELHRLNMAGKNFDDLVTEALLTWRQ